MTEGTVQNTKGMYQPRCSCKPCSNCCFFLLHHSELFGVKANIRIFLSLWMFLIRLPPVLDTTRSNLRESRFLRILENYFAISSLDLDLKAFKIHFHYILQNLRIFLILNIFSKILEKFHFSILISRHFHFTFHFLNFQYPLSQDTGLSWLS